MLLPEKLLLLVPSITALRIAMMSTCTRQRQLTTQVIPIAWQSSLLPLLSLLQDAKVSLRTA
jgi:hypothetical protein